MITPIMRAAIEEARRVRIFAPIADLLRTGYSPTPEEWDAIADLPINAGNRATITTQEKIEREANAVLQYEALMAENRAKPIAERVSTEAILTRVADNSEMHVERVRYIAYFQKDRRVSEFLASVVASLESPQLADSLEPRSFLISAMMGRNYPQSTEPRRPRSFLISGQLGQKSPEGFPMERSIGSCFPQTIFREN